MTPYATNNGAGYHLPQNVDESASVTRSDAVVVRGFREQAGVINPTKPVMSIAEMQAFVRRHLNR